MSTTPIDLSQLKELFDTGWKLEIFVNGLNSYTIIATPAGHLILKPSVIAYLDEDGDIVTDDFTPEQALSRIIAKCLDGRIL